MQTQELPIHITPDLVRRYPLADRKETFENPFESMVPAVHEGPPIFYATNAFPGNGGAWIVRRGKDLRRLYSDTDNFSKKGFTQFAKNIGESWDIIPTELDPPRHTAFRSALNPNFSPKAMGALDNVVRARAKLYIDRIKDRGECDFIADFAVPFPVSIFLDLLGFPQEEMDQFLEWEHKLVHGSDLEERGNATREVKSYLLDAIAKREKNPTDDMISRTIQMEVEGRKWTAEEVFGHCMNLFLGGLDTVSTNIGLQFQHLATHPDDQQWLRDNPKRVTPAIEELLRAYGAVTTFRICTKAIELEGITIQPGDRVAMSTTLAGRDPDDFDGPNEIRFDRKPTHLTLGYGPHRCLGAHLARREMGIAMEEMLAAIPNFRLQENEKVPFWVGNIIHVRKLPICW